MNFDYSDEQRQIREGVQALLRDVYGFEDRRAAIRSESGWRPDVWRRFADMGLLGLSRRDAGAGPVEIMVVMEALGEALVVEPFLETVVIAGSLLSAAGGAVAAAELDAIAAGTSLHAVAWGEPAARVRFADVGTTAVRDGDGWRIDGTKSVVTAGPWANRLLVTARTAGRPGDADGVSLFLIDPSTAGVRLTAYPTIDGRRAADIAFEGVRVPADALLGTEGEALPLLERAGDEAIAAIAAESVGVMRRMLQDTTAFTQQRAQFGQPISRFQVLQHRMVDMFIAIEMATAASLLATLKLEAPARERAMAASTAKVQIAEACRFVGQNAVQLHGGMGMTDETAVSHYFKRATAIEMEFGTIDHHLGRFADLSRAA